MVDIASNGRVHVLAGSPATIVRGAPAPRPRLPHAVVVFTVQFISDPSWNGLLGDAWGGPRDASSPGHFRQIRLSLSGSIWFRHANAIDLLSGRDGAQDGQQPRRRVSNSALAVTGNTRSLLASLLGNNDGFIRHEWVGFRLIAPNRLSGAIHAATQRLACLPDCWPMFAEMRPEPG
jgi:hypothetical protein